MPPESGPHQTWHEGMKDMSVFNRSGLAALSDLETPEWREIFTLFEREQAAFLSKESAFRSPGYKWPRDPLHHWSRVWEYPYVYHHLRNWREALAPGTLPHVVDLGSGVTFFPFAVAKLGYRVTCLDIDPICQKDLPRAAQQTPAAPGSVEFRLVTGQRLPLADGEADALYCISVLEHADSPESMVEEVWRVLTPGGIFIVTFDLDLRGDRAISPEGYLRLTEVFDKHFGPLHPQITVHPANLLTPYDSPYPSKVPSGLACLWFLAKQRLVKPLLGRKPYLLFRSELVVAGFALQKPGR